MAASSGKNYQWARWPGYARKVSHPTDTVDEYDQKGDIQFQQDGAPPHYLSNVCDFSWFDVFWLVYWLWSTNTMATSVPRFHVTWFLLIGFFCSSSVRSTLTSPSCWAQKPNLHRSRVSDAGYAAVSMERNRFQVEYLPPWPSIVTLNHTECLRENLMSFAIIWH